MTSRPTIVTVPCFSGAPWDLDELTPLADRELRTMRLPDGPDDVEDYADFVSREVSDLDHFVLVGDSFGAVVALALATRRPRALDALVLSGGFASNPVTDPFVRLKLSAARFLPGPLYRHLTLRMHARSLESPFDRTAPIPWTRSDSLELFRENTPWNSYAGRAKAAFSADYRSKLERINVPTLILTPEHDELIGRDAARVMLDGIRDSREIVLAETGHMFRYTHPVRYAEEIRRFLRDTVDHDSAVGSTTGGASSEASKGSRH